MTWAQCLARIFAIDMKTCQGCGGTLKLIAAIMENSAIKQILAHLKIPFKPTDIAPSRLATQTSFH